MSERFRKFATWVAESMGTPHAFILAILSIAAWGCSGPYYHWSDTWQIVINTGTTIITFLMVFLIQNTQNRDTLALQVKLSELILALNERRMYGDRGGAARTDSAPGLGPG